MKTLLIFPCQWYPSQPYLSTPYLTSYLRHKGWEVRQRDFNIESYNLFLSQPVLKEVANRLEQKIETIRSKPFLSSKEKTLMDVLSTGHKFSGQIISQVEEAKRVIRTPDLFFDFKTG